MLQTFTGCRGALNFGDLANACRRPRDWIPTNAQGWFDL